MNKLITAALGLAVTVGAATAIAMSAAANDDWYFDAPAEVRQTFDDMVGQPAPDYLGTEWFNGEVAAEDTQGKIVVLDIFATWCGPCIKAIPHNNEMMSEYADDDVMVLSVVSSTGQEKTQQVVDDHDVKYPVSTDPDNAIAKAWNVAFFPTYAVIDRQGNVAGIGLTPDGVEEMVKSLLAKEEKVEG